MSKFLTTSIATVALIGGIGIGYVLTPQYAMSANSASDAMTMTDLGRADRYFDLRYIDAMATHHRGAILLAEQAEDKTQRPELKELSQTILANEPKLIEELYQWKRDWYNNSKQAKDKQVANLGNYDENFDLRYLNALVEHHRAGVEMANEAAAKSTRSEITTNAQVVSDFLNRSANTLEDWRFSWYGVRPVTAMNNQDDMSMLGRADNEVDLQYLNAMIVHHRGAMQLAEQVKDKTRRPEIKSLAEAILTGEPKNIDELYQWKKDWYKDDSKVIDQKVANLGEYDDKLDLRLLNALIAHHEAGLDMNKEIRLKTSRTEVLNSADATDNFFNTTKAQFEKWRSEWYRIGGTSQM